MSARIVSLEDLGAAQTGTVVRSGAGNRWRKREDGLWDCLTDPEWGPHHSYDLPPRLTAEAAS